MGRLDDIVQRNKHPRKFHRGIFPIGIGLSLFVLIVLVLLVFTDLELPNDEPPPPPEKGRVRDIGIHIDRQTPRAVVRDAGVD